MIIDDNRAIFVTSETMQIIIKTQSFDIIVIKIEFLQLDMIQSRYKKKKCFIFMRWTSVR